MYTILIRRNKFIKYTFSKNVVKDSCINGSLFVIAQFSDLVVTLLFSSPRIS